MYRCLRMRPCTICVSGALRGQKRTWDHLEMELKAVVSYHVGVGTQTQVFCKSSRLSKPLNHLPQTLILKRTFLVDYWSFKIHLQAGEISPSVKCLLQKYEALRMNPCTHSIESQAYKCLPEFSLLGRLRQDPWTCSTGNLAQFHVHWGTVDPRVRWRVEEAVSTFSFHIMYIRMYAFLCIGRQIHTAFYSHLELHHAFLSRSW